MFNDNLLNYLSSIPAHEIYSMVKVKGKIVVTLWDANSDPLLKKVRLAAHPPS